MGPPEVSHDPEESQGNVAGRAQRVKLGSLEELRKSGCMTGKVGSRPVCVFWDSGRAYAVEDRCPHMGFPLHRGTVQDGLLTCHWHHARFDLASGGTLDPFADDVPSYEVDLEGDGVFVIVAPRPDETARLRRRLEEGLEQGITLVIAKSVIGLLSAGVAAEEIVAIGVEFGTRYRGPGWGTGLTVLVAMANIVGHLDPADRALALVHGLEAVSDDTGEGLPGSRWSRSVRLRARRWSPLGTGGSSTPDPLILPNALWRRRSPRAWGPRRLHR